MAKVECLKNVSVFKQDTFSDDRGDLFTIWKQSDTPLLNFNHDKVAVSHENVLRGLHTDKSWKFISCLSGKIQLVIVDNNPESKDYLNHMDLILDANENIKTSVLIPPGFLNGHLVLSNQAVFHYKWSYDGDYPDVKDQVSVNWADPKIGIKWLTVNPVLSNRDKNSKLL